MSVPKYPRVLPCGDAAITVEFGDIIDDEVNARVLALDVALSEARLPGVTETVPTYRSLLVHYDPIVIGFDELKARALALAGERRRSNRPTRRWRIPVVYGAEYGIDLEFIANNVGLSADEVVAFHCAGTYRVFMLGFMPGFAYLGGLDPLIAMPRRREPRQNAPPGTVSIGGIQAAVQSVPGPSGWHWIGRTPLRVYARDREPMCLLEPGDHVQFFAISAEEWDTYAGRCEQFVEYEVA
ncbi:5-oxoprolinase subunit PxpB [Filomicrobium sp.]|uniref:5-oxoprolinase subunit PxpB n=1 Tax=Filomicrobium sp. TaxID=2024831 RepID=UPI002590EDAC|nr:5-oxoprolinase subunit PxpB [Filomicrobium sp.]MCV0370148.1 5-oxoprolinase subunit PxpB [Filomicrobium sp.]